MDKVIANLRTYEPKRQKDSKTNDPKNEMSMVLKTSKDDLSGEEQNMAYLT